MDGISITWIIGIVLSLLTMLVGYLIREVRTEEKTKHKLDEIKKDYGTLKAEIMGGVYKIEKDYEKVIANVDELHKRVDKTDIAFVEIKKDLEHLEELLLAQGQASKSTDQKILELIHTMQGEKRK